MTRDLRQADRRVRDAVGPGTENAFGGVAQAYADPCRPGHPRPPRALSGPAELQRVLELRHVTKWIEPIALTSELPNVFRRAFTRVRNGRRGPVLVEVPWDVFDEDIAEPLGYQPSSMPRIGPDPEGVRAVANAWSQPSGRSLRRPGRPLRAAWAELKQLAELLAAPVTTSLQGKSAFPEDHPLVARVGRRDPGPVPTSSERGSDLRHRVQLHQDHYGVDMPAGKAIVHATLDPADLNKDVACERPDRRCQAYARGATRAGPADGQRAAGAAPVADEIKSVPSPGWPSGGRSSPPTRCR